MQPGVLIDGEQCSRPQRLLREPRSLSFPRVSSRPPRPPPRLRAHPPPPSLARPPHPLTRLHPPRGFCRSFHPDDSSFLNFLLFLLLRRGISVCSSRPRLPDLGERAPFLLSDYSRLEILFCSRRRLVVLGERFLNFYFLLFASIWNG